jgi:ferredoxin-type protein NapH
MVNNNKITSKLIPWRKWIQAAFLLLWLDPLGLRFHGLCSPVFHCYACPLATFACPIGVIAQFGALHLIPFITIGILLMVGAVFGSLVCGWACPFGFLQDMAAKIPTPKLQLPDTAGYIRYVVLIIAVILVPYFFGEGHPLFICRICPAGALEAAVPNMIQQSYSGLEIVFPNILKLTILALFLIAIFFIRRPWCRILCPLGAIFSLFNRISVFFLKFEAEKCTNCERCHDMCKYGGQPEVSVDHSSCLRCLECTNCGPEALKFKSIFSKNTP